MEVIVRLLARRQCYIDTVDLCLCTSHNVVFLPRSEHAGFCEVRFSAAFEKPMSGI